MKAFLMYPTRDFGKEELPPNAADLIQDLELETLFRAMSGEDQFLFEVAKKAVLASLDSSEVILYRQQILADCLERPDIIREMYRIAVEALERERKVWGWMSTARYPEGTLHRSVEVLQIFMALLTELRHIADQHGGTFKSEGLSRFFEMLSGELNDEYLSRVEDHLRRLQFRNGLLMSATLGKGHKGAGYILRKAWQTDQKWTERLQNWVERRLGLKEPSSYFYEIADRDEAGFNALRELSGRGIAHVAAALAQSTDHILSFFSMLRLELAFYIGCLNLRDRLTENKEPICFPEARPIGSAIFDTRGLYDVCLSLSMEDRVVGNDVRADDKMLVMITGANRGGKSTFLRSAGLAQLMMQCGMFVPAESFRANLCDGVFTHYKREEDATMNSGKLDEELSRMSAIIGNIRTNSILLLNESFASTNEREGSEIARQIARALLEMGIKVFYVTHLFDLAQGFYRTKMDTALFLRAERLPDGQRTFRLIEGEPLPTSHGEDLYGRIFGADNAEPVALPTPSDVAGNEVRV
jgi:DNA mismatch repair ATPase MutS